MRFLGIFILIFSGRVKSECVKFEYEKKFEDVVLFESMKIDYVSLNT